MASPQTASLANKPLFIANWTGFYKLEESISILDKLLEDCNPSTQQYFIALPFGYLDALPEKYKQSGLIFGADKLLRMDKGAFTAPIAVKLLKNAQAKFTLIRSNGQPDVTSTMIKAVLQAGLTPFLYMQEDTKIGEALQGISPHQLMNVNVIYEPSWIYKQPYCPSLEELVNSYRKGRELLQSQVGIQIANGLRLIGAIPHDFEDLEALLKANVVNGLYLAKAIFHQNQLHRMFASDLHLHGEYEMPLIDENAPLLSAALIKSAEEELSNNEGVLNSSPVEEPKKEIVEEVPEESEEESNEEADELTEEESEESEEEEIETTEEKSEEDDDEETVT